LSAFLSLWPTSQMIMMCERKLHLKRFAFLKDTQGRNVLHHGACGGSVSIIKHMLKDKEDLGILDGNVDRPLLIGLAKAMIG